MSLSIRFVSAHYFMTIRCSSWQKNEHKENWQTHTSLVVTNDCQELSLVWAANNSNRAGKYWHVSMLIWACSKCVMQSNSKLWNQTKLETFAELPITVTNYFFSRSILTTSMGRRHCNITSLNQLYWNHSIHLKKCRTLHQT